ncbi:MAG: rhomboid family intramembrane serine protease, partial [Bacteroidales bacterium]|nr:rhomboid family intramembrane serine protease [Bacteroidales bacterium]
MTIVFIVLTAGLSILAFNRREILYKYQFNAYQIIHRKQYLRLILHGFLHANWTHLLVNMLVLYSFGRSLEMYFQHIFGKMAPIYFSALYLGAILIAPLYSLVKNRNNSFYNAVGASGAVSAVVFAAIFFDPWNKIYFFGLLPIPGIIFAILYLVYSWQMSRKEGDNIAHDTHFIGAVFGFIFPI